MFELIALIYIFFEYIFTSLTSDKILSGLTVSITVHVYIIHIIYII